MVFLKVFGWFVKGKVTLSLWAEGQGQGRPCSYCGKEKSPDVFFEKPMFSLGAARRVAWSRLPLRQGNITQKPWICQQEPLANLLQLEPFKKGLDEKMPKRIVRRKAPKVKLGFLSSRSFENTKHPPSERPAE